VYCVNIRLTTETTASNEAIPVQAYYRPWGFQEVEAPRF